jgi:hypothetical protein
MRKFSQATEFEGEAFRMSEADVADPPSPSLSLRARWGADKDTSIGEFPKCTEDDRAWRKEFSPGALLSVTFLGHARKVTKMKPLRVMDDYETLLLKLRCVSTIKAGENPPRSFDFQRLLLAGRVSAILYSTAEAVRSLQRCAGVAGGRLRGMFHYEYNK